MDLLEASELVVGAVVKVGRTSYQVDITGTLRASPGSASPKLAAPTLERQVGEDVRCE